MKADELFRHIPANIHELHLAIAGLPDDMKVIAHSETDVLEKTVDELRARTTWPSGLVVSTPRTLSEIGGQDNQGSIAKILNRIRRQQATAKLRDEPCPEFYKLLSEYSAHHGQGS
jgi:hypothetical protein